MNRRSQVPGWAAALLAAGLGCGGAGAGGEGQAPAGPVPGPGPAPAKPVALVAEIPPGYQADQRPRFLSLAPAEARAGDPYRYDAYALDPDGEAVRYRLVRAPAGAWLDGSVVRWTPRRNQAGRRQRFTLRAVDEHGLAGVQAWSVLPQSGPDRRRHPGGSSHR